MNQKYRAVLWDFGGVLTSSPFEAFNDFEKRNDLPQDFLRKVNATNPQNNAWAQFERAEITLNQFDDAFAQESAALGHRVEGAKIIPLLSGEVRLDMVEALKQCRKAGLKTACITNNVQPPQNVQPTSGAEIDEQRAKIFTLFDYVVESSKVGIRKPDPKIYLMACDALGIDASQAIYLDDLGINLKPAFQLGMATIKVLSAQQALKELGAILDMSF